MYQQKQATFSQQQRQHCCQENAVHLSSAQFTCMSWSMCSSFCWLTVVLNISCHSHLFILLSPLLKHSVLCLAVLAFTAWFLQMFSKYQWMSVSCIYPTLPLPWAGCNTRSIFRQCHSCSEGLLINSTQDSKILLYDRKRSLSNLSYTQNNDCN